MDIEIREKKLKGISGFRKNPFVSIVYAVDKDAGFPKTSLDIESRFYSKSYGAAFPESEYRIVYFAVILCEHRKERGGPFNHAIFHYTDKEYRHKGIATKAFNYIEDNIGNYVHAYTGYSHVGLAWRRSYQKSRGKQIRRYLNGKIVPVQVAKE